MVKTSPSPSRVKQIPKRALPENGGKIRVTIVEDNPQYSTTLQTLLKGTPGIECLKAYDNASEALPKILNSETDVVIMDLDLPRLSGVESIWHLKSKKPHIECMALTVHPDIGLIFESLKAGATG